VPGQTVPRPEAVSTSRGVRRIQAPVLLTLAALCVLALAGCEFTEVSRGKALYTQHCAICHGPNGRGQNPARPWGSLAPEQEGWIAPALDMRGHCYVHPRRQLLSIIRDGSTFKGTTMIGFKDKMDDDQIRALIAYLETLWDKNTRREYESREKQYAAPGTLPARP
jgi:mono/diheme cytochrome c family protein